MHTSSIQAPRPVKASTGKYAMSKSNSHLDVCVRSHADILPSTTSTMPNALTYRCVAVHYSNYYSDCRMPYITQCLHIYLKWSEKRRQRRVGCLPPKCSHRTRVSKCRCTKSTFSTQKRKIHGSTRRLPNQTAVCSSTSGATVNA